MSETKTKAITTAGHSKETRSQSEIRVKTGKLLEAREIQVIKSRLVLFFNLIGSESGASFLDQWVNEVKRNQSSPGSLSTLNRKLHMLWKQQWFPLNSAVPNQCFDWNRKRWPWVWNEFFVQLLLYDWSISHKCPVNHSRTVLTLLLVKECSSDKDCNHIYSPCYKGICKCKDELIRDGQTCKPGKCIPCSVKIFSLLNAQCYVTIFFRPRKRLSSPIMEQPIILSAAFPVLCLQNDERKNQINFEFMDKVVINKRPIVR